MREKELINFISEVEKDKEAEMKSNEYKETVDYKLRKIKAVKEEATELCLDTLFSKIYKDAVPMDDQTKDMIGDDLDNEIIDFIKAKQPKGTSYYVKEAIKKGSKPAKHIMEAVENMLLNMFRETALNIKDVPADDIKFDIDSPESQEKLNEISSTMQFDELSDAIQNNVKIAANEEINRVKEERQKIKDLEEELKNDDTVTEESTINLELQKRGIVDPKQKLYQPTLFEGVMINKLNLIKESGVDLEPNAMHQLAFIESTKEMTKLFMLKTLMLESFSNKDVKDLARRYATMKERGDISMLREDRLAMYESVYLEGANLDTRKEFKDFKKKYKEIMKEAKDLVKANKYDKSIKKLNEAKALVKKTYDKISDIQGGVGSSVFGFFTGSFPFILRDLIVFLIAIPTFGLASVVDSITEIVERINVVMKDYQKKKVVEVDDINFYRNAIKVRLNEYEKFIDIAIKKTKESKSNFKK